MKLITQLYAIRKRLKEEDIKKLKKIIDEEIDRRVKSKDYQVRQ